MAELNGSNYYRANPYYQQGYLPDIAYKNRKVPNYMVEIPQGQQHFEPTNKKHFQRAGYYTTIGQQHIMDPDNQTVTTSPARDRQYLRNLHVEDIEGANTNTLISKAVKNRMKAKEYLAQKQRLAKEEVQREKIRKIQKREEENKRLEALAKMNRQKEPNYHEKVMKLKTQQSQGRYSPKNQLKQQQFSRQQEEQRYKRPELQPQLNHQPQQYRNYANIHEQQYEQYRRQLQQTQRQIKQLQNQLKQSRQVEKNRDNGQYSYGAGNLPSQSARPGPKYEENIMPQTYQKPQSPVQNNQAANRRISMPEKQYQEESSPRNAYHEAQPERFSLPRGSQPAQMANYRNYSGPIGNQQKLRSITSHQPPEQQRRESSPRNIQSPIYDHRGMVKQTRNQHRRFNPTYLSYGSPAIGLAGRNIVGH